MPLLRAGMSGDKRRVAGGREQSGQTAVIESEDDNTFEVVQDLAAPVLGEQVAQVESSLPGNVAQAGVGIGILQEIS